MELINFIMYAIYFDLGRKVGMVKVMIKKRIGVREILALTLFAIMLAVVFSPITSHAQAPTETKNNYSYMDLEKLESMSLDLDLSNPDLQEQTVYLDNGEKVTIGIQPVLTMDSRATYNLSSGNSTWRIYWATGFVNFEYYINVNLTGSTSKITKAYNPSYATVGSKVNSSKLTSNSTSATYNLKGEVNAVGVTWISYSTNLIAKVSGKKLTTSVN